MKQRWFSFRRGGILIAVSACLGFLVQSAGAAAWEDHLAVALDAKQPAAARNEAILAIGQLPDKDQAIAGLLQCLRWGETYKTAAAVL